ncbi:unnamed protein product, partial [Nesidiocoris tenuis]
MATEQSTTTSTNTVQFCLFILIFSYIQAFAYFVISKNSHPNNCFCISGDYQGEEDYQGEGENDDDYEDEEDDDEDGESDDYSGDDYYNEVHTTPMRRNLDAHQAPSPQIFQRADSPVTQLEDDLHKIMVASGAADSGAAVDLYRKLFGSADESTLGQINNLLPAYLGLLK